MLYTNLKSVHEFTTYNSFECSTSCFKVPKCTMHLGLFYATNWNINLKGFIDADWASYIDTRRSIIGFCIFLGSSLISWKTKKQLTISRSLVEVEYRVMASTTCELNWISYLLSSIQVKSSLLIPLFCDSKSALHINVSPAFHEITKHIDIDCHVVHD